MTELARIIVFKEKQPKIIKGPGGEIISVCMCGLTDLYPFCTGKHIHINEEDKELYAYDKNANSLGKIRIKDASNGQEFTMDNLRSIT